MSNSQAFSTHCNNNVARTRAPSSLTTTIATTIGSSAPLPRLVYPATRLGSRYNASSGIPSLFQRDPVGNLNQESNRELLIDVITSVLDLLDSDDDDDDLLFLLHQPQQQQ